MIKRRIAIIGAAGLLSLAGLTACGSSSSDSSTTAASASSSASASASSGQLPGGGAGMGTVVTGTAATKASAAATAKYPGTADRVMKLSDGSYVVGVTTDDGMVLVQVSKDFVVTGKQEMPQGGRGGTPPDGSTPPAGSTPPSNGTQTTTSSTT
jgi:hypothetical protein